MSHLIPVKRVNKNGVAVTKHVLPQTGASGSKPKLPSPLMSDAGDDWNDVKELVSEYIDSRTDDPYDITTRISKLDPKLRKLITDALLSGDEYSSFTALTAMEECRNDTNVEFIMRSMSFHRVLNTELHRGSSNPSMMMRAGFSTLARRFADEYFGRPRGEVTAKRLAHYKADVMGDAFDFKALYPVTFERYEAMQELVDNIDLIEEAIPEIVQVKAGIRHRSVDLRVSPDKEVFRVEGLLEIAHFAKGHKGAGEACYRYARDRGTFDAGGVEAMAQTSSPALYEGSL